MTGAGSVGPRSRGARTTSTRSRKSVYANESMQSSVAFGDAGRLRRAPADLQTLLAALG